MSKWLIIFACFLYDFLNRNPEQCPSVVSLLAESYNPHVRYGAAMALGIACAGTGLKVTWAASLAAIRVYLTSPLTLFCFSSYALLYCVHANLSSTFTRKSILSFFVCIQKTSRTSRTRSIDVSSCYFKSVEQKIWKKKPCPSYVIPFVLSWLTW